MQDFGQTMKLFCTTVVLSIMITLHGQICNAQQWLCQHEVNYTKGSTFESNLNTVLNNLVQHTSQTGFNTSVYGQSPDQIYGLLQCRGDTTIDQCYNCSQEANTTLRQSCGNASGGLIWLDACFLRYENFSFFGKLDTVDKSSIVNGDSVSSPDVFNAALVILFTNLSAVAVSRSNLYASGTTTDSLSRKIYGLVQCWRDISSDDCTTCLSNKINTILASAAGSEGAQYRMGNCIVRYEIYRFFNSIAAPPTPKAATPINTQIKKSSNKLPFIIGVAGGSLLAVFICLLVIGRRLKSAIFRRPSEGHGQVQDDTRISQDQRIVLTREMLIAATENFHDNNKLGEGGFGAVYKGTTEDGKEIAVKKLSLQSAQGNNEFRNEVELVAKFQHRNLVNLIGCCAEGSERLLVYEYLPNKSLDKILLDPDKRKQLDWQKRYNIILGVARGLLYLHQDSQFRIIHRDIKASNILLDEELNPKITDFGLARLFPEDKSHVRTRVAGTFGYMAPEYSMHGTLSVKADVYSFGVLLLEIITGRMNTDYSLSPKMQKLLGWAWRLYTEGNIVQIIDPTIIETCGQRQALRCIHIGLLCTQEDQLLRPPMSAIMLMLSSNSVRLPNPTKPPFVRLLVSDTNKPTSSGSGLVHACASTSYGLGLVHACAYTSYSPSSASPPDLIVAPQPNTDVFGHSYLYS